MSDEAQQIPLNVLLREIAAIAKAMLAGEESFIEGSRRISALSFDANLRDDPDILPIILVDSETDTLPMGDVQKLWQPSALEKLAGC